MPRSRYLDFMTQQIFEAVERGDMDAAESLVMKYGENFRNDRCMSYMFLYEAVSSRKLEVAHFLLNRGAAVNVDSENYEYEGTLLLWALRSGDMELFKIILSRGSNVNDRGGENRETVLHTAVRLNQLEAVKLLLEHKCDINSVDKCDRTPLLASIEAGTDSLLMLELLFEYQPNLSIQATSGSHNGVTQPRLDALLYAILFKRTDTIIYLLEHGADINLVDFHRRTPLVFAIMLGDEDTCRLLIERGCDINLSGGWEETPLHMACALHHDKIVKLLLTSGSDLNANTLGWTPLHAMFDRRYGSKYEEYISIKPENHSNVFHALLDYGVDLNARIKHDEAREHFPIIKRAHGSSTFNFEITPLHAAVSSCVRYYVDIISLELLLEYGADVNILNTNQSSPLYDAAEDNNDDLFSFLICYGADVSQRCKGNTALSAVDELDVEDELVYEQPFSYKKAMYKIAITWKTLGLATILEEDMTSLRPDELTFYKTFEQQCKSELDNISKFNPSLYLLLTKRINDIPHLAQLEIMNEVFCKTMKDRFPLYRSIMTLRLRRVRFRFSLLEQCKDFSDWLECSLPYDCVERILSFLSNRDLRRLSTC